LTGRWTRNPSIREGFRREVEALRPVLSAEKIRFSQKTSKPALPLCSYNNFSHQRKNDALHMAKEVLNSPPKTNATVKTPKKKTPKKSPSKTPSRSSSADRVYRKSVRGPPSSRSSSKTKITIDPFRRTENSVNPDNEPKWRERTRMEVARGTGLYSSTMKKTPSKPNMAAPPAPEAKTSEEVS
jgi:hypothetical protein